MRRRKRREAATARQPSSPGLTGRIRPVFQSAGDRTAKSRRTGYSAFAEYDGWKCGARCSLQLQYVIRGLDPRIHQLHDSLAKAMDCRVKPGNDELIATSVVTP